MNKFKIVSNYTSSEDQSKAITALSKGINDNQKYQTLLGVTGSGKTFTMAKVIEQVQKPAIILTHNKTLAAQLYREFKELFPENAVQYFVSYYDYYQPEAYVVSKDLYIEKDSAVNDEIDRLRLLATSSILERNDVIIVSSVSCIYGLGNPEDYDRMHLHIGKGMIINRDEFIRKLVDIQYSRNNVVLERSSFRVRGDIVEIMPAYMQESLRIEFFGDEIDAVSVVNPLTGGVIKQLNDIHLYPAKHFVSDKAVIQEVVGDIEKELDEQIKYFLAAGKHLEAQRLETRTRLDIEMLREIGYCNGIENYSRIISRRQPGDRPACLLDYFKSQFVMFVDESHVSLPQVRGMFHGDRARKENLVQYGFRLPCALDNRPLYFEEFDTIVPQFVFVSATPSQYELEKSTQIVEQVIRPTGLLDPQIEVKSAVNQIDDLIGEIHKCTALNERVLVTTLTKRMSEDLSDYFQELGIKSKYLHSEIETIERVEIIRDLRKGIFDVLIGINLLREGLDLPEVSLVAILDADKEGFLRSEKSLIQTSGRAARNEHGRVIMYADKITKSMQIAIDETNRRRKIQQAYNEKNNISPKTISKEIYDMIDREYVNYEKYDTDSTVAEYRNLYRTDNLPELIKARDEIKIKMLAAADNLEFEKAALLRDQMNDIMNKITVLEKR